jgi:leucyl aminopeptidase
MSIKVNFRKNIVENKIINYVLFSDENFKILGLNKTSLSNEATAINKTTENYKIKDNNFLNFNINPNKKIIIVKLKNTSSSIENEKIGAQFYDYIKENQFFKLTLLENNFKEFNKKNKYFVDQFIHGTKLKSYHF